jgi:hypothetical protein
MKKREIVHYNIDDLVSRNADFNILFGERSNGKSYQLKHKRGVIKYLETGKKFILVRRFREEITNEKIEKYFDDVDVEKLTKGKYNCITVYRKQIYLGVFDPEKFKINRGEKIGYAMALSTEQNYAGSSFLDVEDIIFEEFMTRSRYLGENEPDKLMNLYATVDRKRGTTKLWLVGNSISRVCPYIYEWGLHEIISKQKQGTIVEKVIESGEGDSVKLAIEYCKSTGVSSHTIGFNKDMMNDGSWQSSPQPHLPKSKKEYNIIYRIAFMYQSFKFIGEFLQDKTNKDICWFIYPYEGELEHNIIKFTDVINPSIYYQRNIYDITIKNDNLQRLLNTFREDKIFYATDLVGTDFKQVIDFSIRR